MKHFLFVIFIFSSSLSFSQTKDKNWNVGIKNLWYSGGYDNSIGHGLGIFVNHQMTIFNSPKWWLNNELGYEKILTEPEKNRPLFWYQDGSVRYSTSIAREFIYKSNSFTFGLGLSFMYGNQLLGGAFVNGEFVNPKYKDDLSFGPNFSLTFRNSDISDRFGLRVEHDLYGSNSKVTGISLLYRVY